MTYPGGQIQQFGGQRPPLEDEASQVLARVRRGMEPGPPRQPLTGQERAEAAQRPDTTCRLCLAIHPLPNTPGCPRLHTFKTDGDGRVVEGTFRTDTEWHARVVLLEDVHAEDGEETGDG